MAIGTDNKDEQLLNMKQAARLLNVSVISLRRWTNTGTLSCLRVGPKRERRFRRADLLAFLETQATSLPSARARLAPARVSQIHIEGVAIDHGSHLCALYENDSGRVKLAVPFLADGLEAGDVCFLAAAPDAKKHILHELGSVRGSLGEYIDDRRFVVSEGMPSGRAAYEVLDNVLVEATRSGRRAVRVLGDMAWALSQGLSVEKLMDFEMRYNQFLARRFPVVSLCQYDARKFSGTAILDALKCHEDTFRYPLPRFLN
ncbi:MAG: MEDS domain-containing protein [Kiloniellaceae bacterium]